MAKFKDFYGMEIPQRALDLGMIDVSWHNDAGPRMIHQSQAQLDAENDVMGHNTPILTFMCGGEHQARELAEGHGYLIYWAVYGLEPAADHTTFCTDNLEDALIVLAREVALLMELGT